jgi:hypothetical protein
MKIDESDEQPANADLAIDDLFCLSGTTPAAASFVHAGSRDRAILNVSGSAIIQIPNSTSSEILFR